MKHPPRSLFPRRLIPQRSREVRCYPDCPAQLETQPCRHCGLLEEEHPDESCDKGFQEMSQAEACTCAYRDEMAYDAECEARYDRWKNGDYDD